MTEDVNILLLGETGVGKSTFINSFPNYLEYMDFRIAKNRQIRCVIPTKFKVTGENVEERIIQIEIDDCKNYAIAQSATSDIRSYLFPIATNGVNSIRLIDAPSIGDTHSIDQDDKNLENILSYISCLENLHAICFLLKPNNGRLTALFHYYFKQLLSRLEKSASRNIIFLFTNTRDTFYKPGDTTTALEAMLTEIKSESPHADINFTKDNVFCLDNESFQYLVFANNGIKLDNEESFISSWNQSVSECWRMLNFITGRSKSSIKITPHKVKDTVNVNEARRVIIQLSQPLVDIAENINNYTVTIQKFYPSIRRDRFTIYTEEMEAAIKETRDLITGLEVRRLNFEKEKDSLIKTIATCAHFLQRNVIAPSNDSYKDYIGCVVDKEISSVRGNCDVEVIKYWDGLLLRYDEEKKKLDETEATVTVTDIFESIDALYCLPKLVDKLGKYKFGRLRAELGIDVFR